MRNFEALRNSKRREFSSVSGVTYRSVHMEEGELKLKAA